MILAKHPYGVGSSAKQRVLVLTCFSRYIPYLNVEMFILGGEARLGEITAELDETNM